MDFSGAIPLADAIAKMDEKSPVAAALRTKDWENVPLAIREHSLFSAGVDWADFLTTAKEKLQTSLSLAREQTARGSAYVDRSSFIGDMRAMVLAEDKSDGTGRITDLASRARLGLIYDMQIQQAQNFARWKTDQDPDILDAYPAQEFLRVEGRKQPRDWLQRWRNADGKFYAGRMIALKDDPVWTGISRFGTPWPPFDFQSGMGVRDISRKEAEALGVIQPEQQVEPSEAGFNDTLQASLTHVDPQVSDTLVNLFGDLVEVAGTTIKWLGSLS
jgi:hypothetical protein